MHEASQISSLEASINFDEISSKAKGQERYKNDKRAKDGSATKQDRYIPIDKRLVKDLSSRVKGPIELV